MKVDFSFLGEAFNGKPDLLAGYVKSVQQEIESSTKDMMNAIRQADLETFRRAHHRIKPQLESMKCDEVNVALDDIKSVFSAQELKQLNAEKVVEKYMDQIIESLKKL